MADRIIKVLLVEDDVDDYVLIRHLLSEVKGADYMLDWAQSYEQALEKMASTENHVCLLDYRLESHDGLAMARILRNLVENALKYGGEGLRKIQIEYKEGERCCEICVRDDGAGLQDLDDEKIFGLFTRSTNSSGVQGTGLGLAIVKELARQHNGEVWAKGTDGSGAAFFVSISKTP